ncbi:MAG TPA: aldo/keto reductase [Terriglobales bacterium]|nr:aldo/keto reductase [Terriglobales bacterium]
MLTGHASHSGTARFRSRFPALAEAGHFRQPEHVLHLSHLWVSSIGMGTYLGEPDADTDQRYTEAAITAIACGANVLDSAINYRFQRSERSIGAALKQAIDSGSVQRDELLLCTKAGYLTYDGTVPADPRRYFLDEYLDTGIVPREELVGGMHCMAPGYLRNQLERSRRNLGVETIDIFYVHNPEQQLGEVAKDTFHDRLRRAFAALEEEAAAGKIRVYGTATWNGYRQDASSREHLDLAQIAALAREVGGDSHHFRAIQLPFNLGMPEAFTKQNQKIGSRQVSLLAAARELGIAVIGSASLLQGRLAGKLPEVVRDTLGCRSDAAAAIQFARSAPGITSALIGMSHKPHVEENIDLAKNPLSTAEAWESLFQNR